MKERYEVLEKSNVIPAEGINQDYEKKVSDGFISFLKNLFSEKRFPEAFRVINIIFEEYLNNSNFLSWLSKKLGMKRPADFKCRLEKWKVNYYQYRRGHQNSISVEDQKKIYKKWHEHSVLSVDRRNGREAVNIRKIRFLQRYGGNLIDEIALDKKKIRGITYFTASRRMATCTVRKMQKKLADEGQIYSYGTILNMKPFFITPQNERETIMCMCKTCLNTRLIFDAVMKHHKMNNVKEHDSLSGYWMGDCGCEKNENGFWRLSCIDGKCKVCCKKSKPLSEQCMNDEIVKYY